MNAAVASRAAFIFILLTGLGMAPAGQCQTSELGLPILRTWKRLDYKANVQFFSPYQADNGLMYFGNQMAVLEYDGRDWRILKLPVSFARTISPGPAGQIIIGTRTSSAIWMRRHWATSSRSSTTCAGSFPSPSDDSDE